MSDALLELIKRAHGGSAVIHTLWAIVVLTIFCAGDPDLLDGLVRWLSK